MGLLDGRPQPSWYDPGRFWSGDDLHLAGGHHLGGEIPGTVPPPPSAPPKATTGSPWPSRTGCPTAKAIRVITHTGPDRGHGAGMGALDKLKNRFQMGKGHAKQDVGRATGNRSMEAEGQGDRVAGSTKQVGEQAKDAGKNITDASKTPRRPRSRRQLPGRWRARLPSGRLAAVTSYHDFFAGSAT